MNEKNSTEMQTAENCCRIVDGKFLTCDNAHHVICGNDSYFLSCKCTNCGFEWLEMQGGRVEIPIKHTALAV